MKQSIRIAAIAAAVAALSSPAWADTPTYSIIDLGVVGTDTASQAFDISDNGAYIAGRSLGSQYHATVWSAGGVSSLPNETGRSYAVANAVNNAGVAVGTTGTTAFGSSPHPVIWQNGTVTQLAMPTGQTIGQANAINNNGMVVGAVNSGVAQRAAIYSTTGSSVITATTANGSFMTAAFGVNDAGLVIGSGVDPTNAALNVGLVYNSVTGTMSSVGALAGMNGALNFGISNSGFVVGSSMFNQGAGMPFVWSAATGMTAIGLPVGASQGSARGVNDAGWVVGTAGGLYAVPFLYANGTTYRLSDLLAPGTGWDLSTNTSSSAMAITDAGTIVGTGVINGQTHAYEMVLTSAVPEPGTWALLLGGLVVTAGAARRRTATKPGFWSTMIR